MSFDTVKDKFVITGYSDADKTKILNAMQQAYEGSATAKTMFDDWIAAGKEVKIEFEAGAMKVPGAPGGGVGDVVKADLAQLNTANYISPTGKAVEDTVLTAIIHELGHAIKKVRDNYTATDYKGDNVKFVNQIYSELGLPEQLSYIAYSSSLLIRDYDYTKGAAIDAAYVGNGDHNSSALGVSKDLLIGGSGANKLEGGPGDDFLYGAGGNDELNGGDGTDTAGYMGKPTDYDIRRNEDGSWTARHARNNANDEGTDTLKNIEKLLFKDGETHDLKKKGLSFQTDFAFVIDTTGSMGPYIGAVRAQIGAILDALYKDDSIDARVGIIDFRDETIGEPTRVALSFTDHDSFADRKAAAVAALNSLSVGGGGDIPETAFSGLVAALDGRMGKWREGAGSLRIALFTDAPAKDADLLFQVALLASNLGVSFGASSSLVGEGGRYDRFEIGPPENDAARGADEDHPNANPMFPYVPANDPIVQDVTKAALEIFTIYTGPDYWDTESLKEIANVTGGSYITATSSDAIVEALLSIIDIPPDQTLYGTPEDDWIVGRAGNDTIYGLEGNDVLIGLAGNDVLDGGPGVDIFLGGPGNDTYHVDNQGDLVDEGFYFPDFAGLPTDIDTVISTASIWWDVASVAEILRISEDVADDGITAVLGGLNGSQIFGNSGHNIIFAVGGPNTVRAGDGIDFIALSTLGYETILPDIDQPNRVIVDKRSSVDPGWNIVYEFESGKDSFELEGFDYGSGAEIFALGRNDGAGNSVFQLGDGLDILFIVGRELGDLSAADFVV